MASAIPLHPTRIHGSARLHVLLLGASGLLALLAPASARAAAALPDAPAPVSAFLSDDRRLVDWVRDHDPSVAAARARVMQGAADVGRAKVIPNPSVGFDLSNIAVGRTNPSGLGFSDMGIYSVQLQQTVELGKRGPRIDAAGLRLDEARLGFLDTLAGRVAEVREALANVAHRKARLDLLEQTRDEARTVVQLEKRRLEQGDLSGNDFDRLAVDLMGLEADAVQARAEHASALADCAAALTAPCDPGTSPEPLLDAAAPLPEDPADPGARLLLRPDVEAVRLERDAARRDAVGALRKGIPDPTFSVGYTHDQFTVSGDNANSLMVGVSFPLPVFDHGQHDAAKARGAALEQEAMRAVLLRQASALVTSLRARKAALDESLKALADDAMPRSARVLDGTVKGLHQGQNSMTDLLLARRTHTTLILKVVDLRYEAFQVRNDLRRALGLDADLARDAGTAP